ncbi:MAG: transposase [Saprospiraceae bacterium]
MVDKAYEGEFFEVSKKAIGVIRRFPPNHLLCQRIRPVKWRWVSERTFGWFNFFRRLSKDYEKTVESSESWILWANCQMILAKY